MTYEWIVVLCPFMIWALIPFTMWRESRRAKEVGNVASREKSGKVNESQIDFLKPCPKCGGRPKAVTNMWDAVVYPDVIPEYCVMCESCDYEVRSDISMEDAEKEWNRRVEE